MGEEIQVHLEHRDGVTILDIQGDVTALSEPFLNEAYEKANHEGAKKILLRFYEETYINSGGIAVLMQILRESQRNDQQIVIAGLSEHFKKIFDMVGITKFARVYDTQEEALEGLTAGA